MTLPRWPQRLGVELALGADLTASPAEWRWTDASDDLTGDGVSIRRGSASDTTRAQPMTCQFALDNQAGTWTPRHPASPYWPDVHRGVPVRVWLPDTVSSLDPNGGGHAATTTVEVSVTGDLDVRVEANIDWLAVDPSPALAGVWEPADGDRSWLLWLAAGAPVLSWSEDGGLDDSHNVAPMVAVPFSDGPGRGAVRMTLDVDNGDGGHTVTAWVGPGIDGPWEMLGEPIVREGTTSIHAAEVPMRLGPTGELTAPPYGQIYAGEVRDGIDGTVVASPDLRGLAVGTTEWDDDQGNTWQVRDGAKVTARGPVRFCGEVSALTPYWPEGNDPDGTNIARVDVQASSALRRMQSTDRPLHSTLYRHITGEQFRSGAAVGEPRVVAYWPMEDGRDAAHAASPIRGVRPMAVGGQVRFSADSSLAASDSLPSVSAGQPAGWSASVPRANLLHWRVDLFVRLPVSHPEPFRQVLMAVNMTGDVRRWIVEVSNTVIALRGEDILGNVVYDAQAAPTSFFNGWTRVSLRIEQDGADTIVALAWISIGGIAVGWEDTLTSTTAGQVWSVANLWQVTPDEGISFGHLVVSTGTLGGWLASGGAFTGGPDTAFIGEPAAERMVRLAAEEGIPVEVIGDPADTEPLGPQGLSGALDLITEAAEADGGILTDSRDRPGLRYVTRARLYNPEPAVTVSAAEHSGLADLAPTEDDQGFTNDIEVRRVGGSFTRARDFVSVADVGAYESSVTLNLHDDERIRHQGSWRRHVASWPEMRYPSVPLALEELTGPGELAEAWVAADVGSVLHATDLPPEHPPGAVTQIMVGYTESIGPEWWRVEANGVPAGPYRVGVFADPDDLDTGLPRLATEGSELASGVDADDTALSVATTSGPLWVTDPVQFPFDIAVDGEVMTVTAISGASSPQSFTVVRAANGIAKAHDAGAAVQVADPFRSAL